MTATRWQRLVDLVVVLVGRDVRANYGNAALGLVWAPLTAVVQVGVLSFLFLHVVPLDISDYAVFVFTGVAMWQFLSGTLLRGAEAFTDNRDLVRRPGFSAIMLPVVTIAGGMTTYLLSLPVLLTFVAATGRLRPSVVALPVVLAAAALVVAGPAFIAATMNVRYRDVRHLVGVLVGVLFYLTPVFYDVDRIPERFRWIADANPLALAVRLHRQVLYDGVLPDPGQLVACIAFGLVGTTGGMAVFRRFSSHLPDDL